MQTDVTMKLKRAALKSVFRTWFCSVSILQAKLLAQHPGTPAHGNYDTSDTAPIK